jgi:hypothetical protein
LALFAGGCGSAAALGLSGDAALGGDRPALGAGFGLDGRVVAVSDLDGTADLNRGGGFVLVVGFDFGGRALSDVGDDAVADCDGGADLDGGGFSDLGACCERDGCLISVFEGSVGLKPSEGDGSGPVGSSPAD